MIVVLLALLVVGTSGIPASPGYQLGEPRTNAIGVGAAGVFSDGSVVVVGGSGDSAKGPTEPLDFLFRDTRLFRVSDQSWSQLQPLPMGQQRAFHSLHRLDADRILLFAGRSDSGLRNDLWVYSRGEHGGKEKRKRGKRKKLSTATAIR